MTPVSYFSSATPALVHTSISEIQFEKPTQNIKKGRPLKLKDRVNLTPTPPDLSIFPFVPAPSDLDISSATPALVHASVQSIKKRHSKRRPVELKGRVNLTPTPPDLSIAFLNHEQCALSTSQPAKKRQKRPETIFTEPALRQTSSPVEVQIRQRTPNVHIQEEVIRLYREASSPTSPAPSQSLNHEELFGSLEQYEKWCVPLLRQQALEDCKRLHAQIKDRVDQREGNFPVACVIS